MGYINAGNNRRTFKVVEIVGEINVFEYFILAIGIIACLWIFIFVMKKPYYAVGVYYAIMFGKRLVLPDARVRETVIIEILAIAFLMGAVYFGIRVNRNKVSPKISIPIMHNSVLPIGAVVIVECINGLLNGYGKFAILVDVFKVAEILIFYLFFSYVWRSTKALGKGLKFLIIEMCLFGIIEMFTTERGGIGINMAMSLFPIIFAWGFYKKKKYYWLINFCCFLIVFTSKTRTYLMGFILGMIIIFILAKGIYKQRNFLYCLMGVMIGSIAVGIYIALGHGEYFLSLISRILELSEGFSEAGGYRIYEIHMAIKKFLEAPLLGKGYGYVEYLYIERMGSFNWGDFMHNTYVEILAKTGIFGFLIYGVSVVKYLLRQIKYFSRVGNKNPNCAGLLIGGCAGTLSWLFVFFAAPLSSYGVIFIPGIIAMLYTKLWERELNY